MKNLLLHICKKDFRHLWPWLVLWWGTFVFNACYTARGFEHLLHTNATTASDSMGVMLNWLCCLVLLLVIVANLIEADSPTNDRALWRTLPLPPSQLFIAKLSFLVICCLLVPVLIKVASLAHFGFSPSQAWPVIGGFVGVLAYAVGVLFLAGLLFSRPAIGYGVLAALFLAGIFVVNLVEPNGPRSAGTPRDAAVFVSLFGATLVASSACIYLQQRRRLAVLILLAYLGLTAGLACILPSAPRLVQPLPPSLGPDFPLSMPLDHVSHSPPPPGSPRDFGEFTFLEGNVSTATLPPLLPAEVWVQIRSAWTFFWPDHTQLSGIWPRRDMLKAPVLPTETTVSAVSSGLHTRVATATLTYTPSDDAEYDPPLPPMIGFSNFPVEDAPMNFAEALRPFGVQSLYTGVKTNKPVFGFVADPTFSLLVQKPARMEGNITFLAERLEEIIRLPVVVGAIERRGPEAVGLISYDFPASSQVTLSLAMQVLRANSDLQTNSYNEVELLINKRTGQALLGYRTGYSVWDISDVVLQRREIVFRFDQLTSPGLIVGMSPDEIKSWLADAEYVHLRFVPVGTRVGTFQFDPVDLAKDHAGR